MFRHQEFTENSRLPERRCACSGLLTLFFNGLLAVWQTPHNWREALSVGVHVTLLPASMPNRDATMPRLS